MSFRDIFSSKKKCTVCAKPSLGLHRVYTGVRNGSLSDQLCSDCLVSRLGIEIRGKSILFIEPLTTDGYCYAPFGDVSNQGLTRDRVHLALSSLASQCAVCSSVPNHLWMPLNDLDDAAMQKQPQNAYYPIPSEPALWKSSVSLCHKHLPIKIREYIDGKRCYFRTFRFPSGLDSGYYW